MILLRLRSPPSGSSFLYRILEPFGLSVVFSEAPSHQEFHILVSFHLYTDSEYQKIHTSSSDEDFLHTSSSDPTTRRFVSLSFWCRDMCQSDQFSLNTSIQRAGNKKYKRVCFFFFFRGRRGDYSPPVVFVFWNPLLFALTIGFQWTYEGCIVPLPCSAMHFNSSVELATLIWVFRHR